jgi:IS5 family transposase
MGESIIVDATLIAAPPSARIKDGKRDPEMHQAKKGNDWHFDMKAHIGVDAASGLVHGMIGTASNMADVTQVMRCCTATRSQRWRRRLPRRGKGPRTSENRSRGTLGRMQEKLEHPKTSVRAKVEHRPHLINNLFTSYLNGASRLAHQNKKIAHAKVG